MRVLIVSSEHVETVIDQIKSIDETKCCNFEEHDENTVNNKHAIGEIIELLLSNEGSAELSEEVMQLVQENYGDEIIKLKDDIMNKLAKLNESEWFKEIYLHEEINGVLLIY